MDRLLLATTLFAVALIFMVLFSVRRLHIRVEYSVSWLAAAAVLLLLSRSTTLLNWLAGWLGLTYPPLALVLIVFAIFLVVFYRFSVMISDLKDANIAMAQRLAILEFKLQSDHESK
jgi:hypothetical protein